ncbi:MAG: DNA replication/repair protein RecF [Defluviitaleaceae bacterium]|nr:DNA replication/repair protein RecF [Defluviitaleaceae bacterium]
MIIETVELKNYRNISSLFLTLHPGINILHGDNAQGKTNFLESIYVCATGRSHRTNRDSELIMMGMDVARIKLIIAKEHGIKDQLDMQIRQKNNGAKNKSGSKSALVNSMPIGRLGELYGLANIVIFSPEDLQLIKSGPNLRRRFMDMELCQLYPNYYHNLRRYHRVLKQRNNLLKTLQKNRKNLEAMNNLDAWDIQLSEYGIKIIEIREEFIEKIKEIAAKIHKDITAQNENLEIFYKKSVNEQVFLEKLIKTRERDILQGTTSSGIHKDDILLTINNLDVHKFASQGQQRTAALALKLSEIQLVEEETGQKPVLLLDDVLSELDSGRQSYLFSAINSIQIIITTTGKDEIFENIKNRQNAGIFTVSAGIISSKIS